MNSITTNIILNQQNPQPSVLFSPPRAEDLPSISFKNFRSLQALEADLTPYCRSIIERILEMPSELPYAYIDVKFQKLRAGQPTTRDTCWHLDSSFYPDTIYDNFLFVSGQYALTQFVTTPLPMPNVKTQKEFHDYIEAQQPEIESIEPCTITRYNGRNVHRGPHATADEERLLIRVVKTTRCEMPARYL